MEPTPTEPPPPSPHPVFCLFNHLLQLPSKVQHKQWPSKMYAIIQWPTQMGPKILVFCCHIYLLCVITWYRYTSDFKFSPMPADSCKFDLDGYTWHFNGRSNYTDLNARYRCHFRSGEIWAFFPSYFLWQKKMASLTETLHLHTVDSTSFKPWMDMARGKPTARKDFETFHTLSDTNENSH